MKRILPIVFLFGCDVLGGQQAQVKNVDRCVDVLSQGDNTFHNVHIDGRALYKGDDGEVGFYDASLDLGGANLGSCWTHETCDLKVMGLVTVEGMGELAMTGLFSRDGAEKIDLQLYGADQHFEATFVPAAGRFDGTMTLVTPGGTIIDDEADAEVDGEAVSSSFESKDTEQLVLLEFDQYDAFCE